MNCPRCEAEGLVVCCCAFPVSKYVPFVQVEVTEVVEFINLPLDTRLRQGHEMLMLTCKD